LAVLSHRRDREQVHQFEDAGQGGTTREHA
jgi:hypothetical protein